MICERKAIITKGGGEVYELFRSQYPSIPFFVWPVTDYMGMKIALEPYKSIILHFYFSVLPLEADPCSDIAPLIVWTRVRLVPRS